MTAWHAMAILLVASAGSIGVLRAQQPAGNTEKKQAVNKDPGGRKYQEGLDHERAGRDAEAFEAYLQAGEAGHGLAQLKIANIYDRGNKVIKRDYQSAIRWYEKARQQGVELAKPLSPIRGR